MAKQAVYWDLWDNGINEWIVNQNSEIVMLLLWAYTLQVRRCLHIVKPILPTYS